MNLKEPKMLKGLFQSYKDERGFLNPILIEKLLNIDELADFDVKLQLMSYTKSVNTFRGFHYQKPPAHQAKVLIVHKGKILDMVFPTKNFSKKSIQIFHLNAGDVLMIPENYAHGFYTKSSNTILQYLLNKDFSAINYTGLNGSNFIKKLIGKDDILISDNDRRLPLIDALEN
jgi:dTDP-4-dehydrorhamnose 3,5-epimerase